jgi:hypothetical protein
MHIHTRESARRLSYEICERLDLCPRLFQDDFYKMIDDVQKYGAVEVFRWARDLRGVGF